jgi:nitrate reductase gamma subunit
METWLELARGPVFLFAISFMVLGLARHVILTCWEACRTYYRAGDKVIPYGQVAKNTWQWLLPVYKLKERTLYGLTTVVFHVSIILTPILLGGHIALIRRGTGLGWPAIPNILADYLTAVAVLAALAVIVQRVTRADSRAVGKFRDYAILFLITIPFVSGFLVMHPSINPFPFDVALLIHVMSANLVMILIPVTKLSHCALTPISQIVSEFVWHWPADAGSKLASTLGKENEPV